ncbi:MAG: succinate dehydrogenase, cytochrome b556 subunit, partial [Endozoicomonadaceae bacterium]|nr:succinate dehydrogenase, cytochrome b556 subunit [Endozoicomonadaceae bacterium]
SVKFPLTAYTSILHRISGFFLLFFIAFFLYALRQSLEDAETFNALKSNLQTPWIKFVAWILLSTLAYHFIAGVKHLIADMGFAEEKDSGKTAAAIVLILTVIAVILLGVWIW